MTSWLSNGLRIAAALLALSLGVFGHASSAGAMAPMSGMEHDSAGTICRVLCTSALTQRQAVLRDGVVDDDDHPATSGISAAPLLPPAPRRLVADSAFQGGPPSKVPLYLRLQLIRV